MRRHDAPAAGRGESGSAGDATPCPPAMEPPGTQNGQPLRVEGSGRGALRALFRRSDDVQHGLPDLAADAQPFPRPYAAYFQREEALSAVEPLFSEDRGVAKPR